MTVSVINGEIQSGHSLSSQPLLTANKCWSHARGIKMNSSPVSLGLAMETNAAVETTKRDHTLLLQHMFKKRSVITMSYRRVYT